MSKITTCELCRTSTSGSCWEHSTYTLPTPHYPPPVLQPAPTLISNEYVIMKPEEYQARLNEAVNKALEDAALIAENRSCKEATCHSGGCSTAEVIAVYIRELKKV